MTFYCHNCGMVLHGKHHHEGKCPACEEPLIVPRLEAMTAARDAWRKSRSYCYRGLKEGHTADCGYWTSALGECNCPEAFDEAAARD